MDYYNDVFTTFLGLERVSYFVCGSESFQNKSLMGLEWRESE